jgi:hypothetical protein
LTLTEARIALRYDVTPELPVDWDRKRWNLPTRPVIEFF